MKRNAELDIYQLKWWALHSRGHYCSRAKPCTPRRTKPVTPLTIKLSVGRRRLLHIDGKQMPLLAAVSAHMPPRGGAAVIALAAAGTSEL